METGKHYSADNVEITLGAKFWDNNLKVVQITKVADYSNPYADSGETQTWHSTTKGSCDTLTGSMRPYGRLAHRFEGKDAEDYPAGTSYRDAR